MKKEKKYDLLKAIGICFLFYIILSWIIPTGKVSQGAFSKGNASPLGIFEIFYYPGIALGTFIQYAFVLLAIGAFYGVMAKTGVYGKLIDSIAKKFKGKERLFLIIVIALMAIASSVIGISYALLVIIPFLMAVLTKLGYNKITSVAATIGALLVGEIGSTFGLGVAGMSKAILGLKISEWIWFKLGLLVVITALFVLYVLGNKQAKLEKVEKVAAQTKTTKSTKTSKTAKETKTTKTTKKVKEEKEVVTKAEVKKSNIIFLEDEKESKKSSISLVILFVLTFLFAVITMYNLRLLFDITFFNDLYEQITNITIKDYPIFKNILGLLSAFGTWDSYELVALLLISSCIIGWVYSLSFDSIVDGMVEGAKKMLRPAFYITIANILFTMMLVTSQTGTMVTFVTEKFATRTENINFATAIGASMFGSFFYNNFNYLLNEIATVYSIHVDNSGLSILSFILQGIHGVMMMILPTSLMLVSGLSMMEVSFKEWIKYIWKYVLQIFIIVVVLSVIILMIA